MKRPDQDRFDLFARHFESLDSALVHFCQAHDYQLEINYFRQPSRVLKREGNPTFLIDISLSEHWLKMKFEDDMPHTITVIGYYEPPSGPDVWRLAQEIVCEERYSLLQQILLNHLEKAHKLINNWTPEVIMQRGQREENLKRKYGK